jgi:hypothetical protein
MVAVSFRLGGDLNHEYGHIQSRRFNDPIAGDAHPPS